MIGLELAQDWHRIGIRLAWIGRGWLLIGSELAPDWSPIGFGLLRHWLPRLAKDWPPIGSGLASDWLRISSRLAQDRLPSVVSGLASD